MHFVILKSGSCPWCVRAKEALLRAFPDAKIEEHVLIPGSEYMELIMEMGLKTVPQVFKIEETGRRTYIGGYGGLESWIDGQKAV